MILCCFGQWVLKCYPQKLLLMHIFVIEDYVAFPFGYIGLKRRILVKYCETKCGAIGWELGNTMELYFGNLVKTRCKTLSEH